MKRVCRHCGEEIPHLSRICPTCLYNDSFSADILEVETPLHMLHTMRSMLDEYLAAGLPKIWHTDKYEDSTHEAIATFEAVRDVVLLSFGKKSEVMEAVSIMEDILYARIDQRRKRFRRNQIIRKILATILIFSLSALACLTLRVA